MYPLDLEAFRLSTPLPAGRPKAKAAALPRHRKGQHFLKGPIPWDWVLAAMGLRGAALHVGVFVWHLAGLKRSATVSLNQSSLPLPRTTVRRGLTALERAGLVSVVRHAGRMPLVTILEVNDE